MPPPQRVDVQGQQHAGQNGTSPHKNPVTEQMSDEGAAVPAHDQPESPHVQLTPNLA